MAFRIIAGVVALAFALGGLVVCVTGLAPLTTGVRLTHVALLVACIAATCGDRWFTAAATITSALAFTVAFDTLSPALLAVLSGHGAPDQVLALWLVALSFILLALPIIAISFQSRNRAGFG